MRAEPAADRAELARATAHMLRLDEDLAPLYALTDGDPKLAWARAAGAGRLLRAPSIFEDLIKMLLTTNCSWSLTRVMVERLVSALGEPAPSGRRAFPTAERMAREREKFYREVVRAGYRAPHLVKIARDAARGRLALDSLADERDPERVRDRLLALPGIGPYAADNLLRLVGAYGYLGLDSWCRARIRKLFPRARDASAFAHRRWRRYGRFQGLAMWLELTAHWHQGGPPSLAP